MKKPILSLLCLAILWAVPITVSAETEQEVTLYGNLRYSFNFIDDDRSDIDGFRGTNNVSKLGIKGSHGNDFVKAFFHLQTEATPDADGEGDAFNQRFFYGGFDSEYGKVSFGRMTNAYKYPGFAMDPFYDLSRVNAAGLFGGGGASYGLSPATNAFTDNSLQYVTPDIKGLKLVGGIAIDDNNNDEVGALGGGSFTIKGFTVGGVYADNGHSAVNYPNIDADGYGVRGYATYKNDDFKLGASYENLKTGGEYVNYAYGTGTAMIKDIKTDVSFSFGYVDEGAAEGFGFTSGIFYHILDNACVYAMASYTELTHAEDPFVCSLGATYDFKLTAK